MPFYEYECSQCRYYAEVMQKISDTPLKKCPSCGKNTFKKLISAPVFRLKGSGWYETDFKSDQESRRNLAEHEAPSGGSAEAAKTGAETKGEGATAGTDAKPGSPAAGSAAEGRKGEGSKAEGSKSGGTAAAETDRGSASLRSSGHAGGRAGGTSGSRSGASSTASAAVRAGAGRQAAPGRTARSASTHAAGKSRATRSSGASSASARGRAARRKGPGGRGRR
jgi:putative FmdB family regulatory protein